MVVDEGGTFSEPAPDWLFYGPLLLLAVLTVVTVVLCLRGAPGSGWDRRVAGAVLAVAGAAAAAALWAVPVDTGGPGGETCAYDPLGSAFGSGDLTASDRACRTASLARVGAGVAMALSTCVGGVVVARRTRPRRPAAVG